MSNSLGVHDIPLLKWIPCTDLGASTAEILSSTERTCLPTSWRRSRHVERFIWLSPCWPFGSASSRFNKLFRAVTSLAAPVLHATVRISSNIDVHKTERCTLISSNLSVIAHAFENLKHIECSGVSRCQTAFFRFPPPHWVSKFIDSIFSIYGELQGDEVKELFAVNQPTTSLAFGCG